MRRLFTAGTDDTVHRKRPSFQPFPSGKGRETVFPGALPPARRGGTAGGIAGHGFSANGALTRVREGGFPPASRLAPGPETAGDEG